MSISSEKYINSKSAQYFAFNIWGIESAKAVIDAAALLNKDVILQTSSKIFEKLDKHEFRNFVKSYSINKKINAYLHLDHCRNIEIIQRAIDNNWDSVMIDASHLSLDENIYTTQQVISLAHPKGILVEAEIGQINGTEEDIVAKENKFASLQDIKQFVNSVKIDMLAAAIGTAHGIYRGAPAINYELIKQTAAITDIPFVIHGGSGLNDDVFSKFLSYSNVKKINISTEVKLAYRNCILKSFHNGLLEEQGFDALMVTDAIHDSIMKMSYNKLKLLTQTKDSQ